MITTTLSAFNLCKSQVIALGRQLETNYRQIVFDCSDFSEEITAITLIHQRKDDVAPYIVATSTGDTLTWTITDTDTAYYGYGKGELRITFDSGLAKSIVFTTMVIKSITADTTIPSALQSWYDAMIAYINGEIADSEGYATAAQTSAETAAQEASDSEAWAVGERNGTAVGSTDETYQNNSKYYAEETADAVSYFVNTTVPAKVAEVTAEGTRQIGLVSAEGTAQVSAVQSAGSTQIGLVQSEGTTQKNAVIAQGQATIASIPSDYTALSNDVSEIENGIDGGINLFVKEDAQQGVALIYTGGTTTSGLASNKFTSDYITVVGGRTYYYAAGATSIFYVASYDSGKTFIQGSWQTTGFTYTPPENATYIRFTDYLEFINVANFYCDKVLGTKNMSDTLIDMETAESGDIGKYLKAVAVTDGSVSDWELGNPCEAEYLREFNGQVRDSMLTSYGKLVAGTLKWTILGDSITDTWDGHAQAGGGATDSAHGYAKIVARWLSTKYGNGLTFVNNGTGGITASGSISKVAEYLEGNGFDLIVVALGTNDWNIQTALATFETNYNALLDEIGTRCPNAEIAMIGLGYFDGWKPEKLIRENEYNDVLQKIARERDIRFVCPYFEMENAIVNGGYTFADITYAPDPVHPNDIGHRIWADTVYKLFDIL